MRWTTLMKNILDRAMKDFFRPKAVTRAHVGDGFRRIPAVSLFLVQKSGINEILDGIGIDKSLKPRMKIKLEKNAMNRYIDHQIKRALEAKKVENYELYWLIATSCIRRSISFRVSSVIKCWPTWYRIFPLHLLANLLKKVENIVRAWDTQLVYYRRYLVTPNKTRPLGVPTGEWRVVMNMWNNWITMFVYGRLTNHAYQPGKGTVTAWLDVINKARKAKYIYEFDLKSFFENVPISKITRELIRIGIVPEVAFYLDEIHRRAPKNILPEGNLLDETKAYNKFLRENGNPYTGKPKIPFYEKAAEFYKGTTNQFYQNHILDRLFWDPTYTDSTEILGVPQGLNTSPMLSIIYLQTWLDKLHQKGLGTVVYADDGIIYSEKDFIPDLLSDPFVKMNLTKSRWVKREGKWLSDLKFLGMKLINEGKMIKGSTRAGKELEFSSDSVQLFKWIAKLKNELYPLDYLDRLSRTSLMGLVTARIYNGSWRNIEFEEHEWKIYKGSWWAIKNHKGEKGDRTVSSVAAYYLAALIKHSRNKGTRLPA